ncbi:MAG: hypothetical protein HFE90_10185 [Firmicutes bacterium]|nr:hypothetical protein [Bacillota bacterium]
MLQQKFFIIMIAICLLFSFSSCGNNDIPNDNIINNTNINKQIIDNSLQGSWVLRDNNTFNFTNGKIIINDGEMILTGIYEINTENDEITGKISTRSGTVSIHLPYKYEENKLTLYNNRGDAMVKH